MKIVHCRAAEWPVRLQALVGALLLSVFGGVAQAAEASGTWTGGPLQLPYQIDGVPVLDSFRFTYVGDDHHLRNVGVRPASLLPSPLQGQPDVPPGQVAIDFSDDNLDDDYRYTIAHGSVGLGVFKNRVASRCVSACTLWLNRPSASHVFALSGFRLRFANGDHHLRRVAIFERAGVLHVHFRDENGDDPFTFEVDYVYLPSSAVARFGSIGGGQDNRGAIPDGDDSRAIDLGIRPVGATLVTGFDFEYWPDLEFGTTLDNHIQDFGVLTPSNRIDVYFADAGRDDGFRWGVDWVALALPSPFGDASPPVYPKAP